jgi:hypothetical protein
MWLYLPAVGKLTGGWEIDAISNVTAMCWAEAGLTTPAAAGV